MPGGTVGNETVPTFRTPALGDSAPFKNEVRHPALTQMGAHGHSGLARAHNEYFDFLN